MKFSNKLLDELAGDRTSVLVFDCEFWHVLNSASDNGYIVQEGKDFFFVPREIGGFILKKINGQWEYNKNIYVTLDRPKRDVAFPISHYSTVTGPTGYKLDEIEKKLPLPWGEAYPSRLSEEATELYNEGLRFYENDPNIKKNRKPNSWYSTFMEVYSQSIIVVKGDGDINALKNASNYWGFEYQEPLDVVDIGFWNPQSRKRCGTAKLEGTYKCIKNKLDEESKVLQSALPLGKSHDPVVDAAMTLLVALYIQSQKPKIKI